MKKNEEKIQINERTNERTKERKKERKMGKGLISER